MADGEGHVRSGNVREIWRYDESFADRRSQSDHRSAASPPADIHVRTYLIRLSLIYTNPSSNLVSFVATYGFMECSYARQ